MVLNLTDLIDAYKSGRLTTPLMIDNDTASVYDPDDDYALPVFEMHPAILLESLLDILGIPHEHV